MGRIVAVVALTLVVSAMTTRLISIRTNAADMIPLSVLLDEYRRDGAFSPDNTRRAKESDLEAFEKFLAESLQVRFSAVLIEDVSQKAIEAFRDERLKVESPATVARRLSTLKHLFRAGAKKHGFSDPSESVQKPAVSLSDFKALSDVQIATLRQHPSDRVPRVRFLLELLTLTGLRASEARNARLGDISDDFRFLDVVGKGGKRRIVPIVPALLSELNLYMRWRYQWTTRPEYPLLLSKTAATRNKPESWRVNSKTLWRDVHDAAIDVGIENHLAHPHALRHTFARRSLAHLSLIYGAAEALNILRLTMGHSTISTTMLYLTEGREALFNALAEVA